MPCIRLRQPLEFMIKCEFSDNERSSFMTDGYSGSLSTRCSIDDE